MRKFRVVVNGEVFEVEVEEISLPGTAGVPGVGSHQTAVTAQAAAPAAAPAAPSTRPAGPPASAPARPAGAPGPARAAAGVGREPLAEGEVVRAPLPGMITDVKVAAGQEVKVGEVLLVLEAMKMENEVLAPVAGTVRQVLVERGTAVSAGDPLVVIGRS